MTDRTRWPLPERVAAYGDRDEFERSRKEAGQWVFWDDRVQLVLSGRYDEVRPLHVELSPTYLCNFACPWCSCRSAREEWSDADVFSHPRATPLTVIRDAKLDRVLGNLESGIDVVVPEQSATSAPGPEPDDRGCIAAGWFGEVTPNGDMVLCSDRYGNPDYFIGNVAQATMDEIWAGGGRRSALRLAKRTACYQTYCPSNGRGFFFNRLFREIEQFRNHGRLEEVRAWISDLRAVLPVPAHSFFI